MKTVRRSPLTALATGVVAVVAVTGLGACTSNPSEKAVVTDVVETLAGLSDAERTCMLDKIELYSEDELKAIGKANEAVDFNVDGAVTDQGTPELQKFVSDLSDCMSAG